MVKIDARGLSCPEPVVLTRKAAVSGARELEIAVDNICAVENVSRYGKNNGFTVEKQENGDDWILILKK